MNKIGMIAAALALGISSAQADFTQGLLARWSFNDNSNEAKALTDDVGGLTMKRSAIGSDSKFKVNADGSVTLGGGVILFSDAVNSASEKFGVLADGGTIWCRIKYLNAPAGGPFFSFELVNAVAPGDWAQLVLTPFFASEGLGSRAKGPGKLETGMASGHLPVKVGEYANVAIVFNGKTKKVTLFVDGKTADRHSPMTKLDAFQSLMIGRLKASSAQQMQIDEIRVYNTPLSAEWIDEIEPLEGK